MCGIFGWVQPSGIDLGLLVQSTQLVNHRGPDGYGFWLWDGRSSEGKSSYKREDLNQTFKGTPVLGLGHRRLAILDLSDKGLQPMSLRDKKTWITYNGEVYNYKEIQKELKQLGYIFETGTDTEVILAAYQAWGSKCFSRFNGMWALCIVDLEKRKIILSRDRLGVKPLYICSKDSFFTFGSEIKQLLRIPNITSRVNKNVFIEYIRTSNEAIEETFFEDIKPFPAGHYVEIPLDDLSKQQPLAFWKPESLEENKINFDDAEQHIKFLFEDAVKLRLRSDVPVGVSLSGGIDSSSIYGQVQILRGKEANKTHTFSAIFDDWPASQLSKDERPFIKAVLDKFGGVDHYTKPNLDSFLDCFDKFTFHHDEPIGSFSQFASYSVMQEAKTNKVPVVLNGQGSDEIFSGYWGTYFRFLKRNFPNYTFFKHLLGSLSPSGNNSLVRELPFYFSQHLKTKRDDVHPYIKSDWKNYGHLEREKWMGKIKNFSSYQYRLAELRELSLPRLLKYDDRNSMASGIEVRHPFLDYRLVEYGLSLPVEYNLHRGWNKYIVRKALGHLLPSAVQWRKSKIGFETPQHHWLKTQFRHIFSNWFENMSPELKEVLEINTVSGIYQKLVQSKLSSFEEEDHRLLMRLFFLDRWIKVFNVSI